MTNRQPRNSPYQTRQKRQKFAIYVGGLMDGERVEFARGFAGFKHNDGKRTGYKWQQANWHQPLSEFRFPRDGYCLDKTLRGAFYVHHTRWYDFTRGDDEESREFWREQDAIIARHDIDSRELDLDPLFAAAFLEEYDRDSRGVDATTYCQERRQDVLAAFAADPDIEPFEDDIPFRDEWGTPLALV